MKKISSLFLYITMAISVVVIAYFFWEMKSPSRVNILLIWTYVLFAVAILLTLVFSLVNAASNPKSLRKMALNIGFLVVVLGVAFLLSSSAQTSVTAALPDGPPSAMAMKLTDMALKSAYFLFSITVLAAIFSPVIASMRNR